MTQFLRDEASDSEEVVTSLMLDGTYLSRNFATLGPVNLTAAVCSEVRESTINNQGRKERKWGCC